VGVGGSSEEEKTVPLYNDERKKCAVAALPARAAEERCDKYEAGGRQSQVGCRTDGARRPCAALTPSVAEESTGNWIGDRCKLSCTSLSRSGTRVRSVRSRVAGWASVIGWVRACLVSGWLAGWAGLGWDEEQKGGAVDYQSRGKALEDAKSASLVLVLVLLPGWVLCIEFSFLISR